MDASEPPGARRGTCPQRLVSKPRGATALVLRAVTVVGLSAYAAHSLIGLGGHGLDGFFEDWVFNGLLLASSALCLLRAAWSKLDRGAWSALGAGLGCWALGEVVFTLDPAQVSTGSFPATSDFLWLVFYPAAFLTLGLLVRARVRQFYPSLWLDGAVGAVAVAALACQFILPPIIAGTGIEARIITERYRAGESIAELAQDYRLDAEKIEDAIRCETSEAA